MERRKQHFSSINIGEELLLRDVTSISVSIGHADGQKLPVHLFDNKEFDMYNSSEWIARGTQPGSHEARIGARSVRDPKGSAQQDWVTCVVVGLTEGLRKTTSSMLPW